MKLSYRSVKYEARPSVLEVTEGEIGGTYRGQQWRFHYPRHIPEPLPVHDLKWRGVAYRTGQATLTEPIQVAQAVAIAATKLTFTGGSHTKVVDETANIHLKNIQRSLEHRLQVAKAKGDENLVRLLEKESEQMALHF
ncbi:MAG TPA: hypothetical protein DDZ80_21875 [Cyanobacteria bacterium UBA8803]|nr:hypothetical protein [Cyanobacteria bacterium UBA9273]HBL60980.1 hypothetical protein [Cyanobacteria bacterium UBA8803]